MTFLILNFETGDSDCPYWTVYVTVDGRFDGCMLEDAFMSYFEQDDSNDASFEDATKDVLDSMGWEWAFIDTKVPACDYVYTMWL